MLSPYVAAVADEIGWRIATRRAIDNKLDIRLSLASQCPYYNPICLFIYSAKLNLSSVTVHSDFLTSVYIGLQINVLPCVTLMIKDTFGSATFVFADCCNSKLLIVPDFQD